MLHEAESLGTITYEYRQSSTAWAFPGKTEKQQQNSEERKDGSKRQTTHRPPALRVQALSITGGERETQRDAVSLPKDTWFTAAGVRSSHFLLT